MNANAKYKFELFDLTTNTPLTIHEAITDLGEPGTERTITLRNDEEVLIDHRVRIVARHNL